MAGERPYYGQPGYYTGRYQAPVEPPHPHKKFRLIVIIIFLIILIVAVILYWATAPEEQQPIPRTTTTTGTQVTTTVVAISGELEIRNMQFAERIYDDYRFVPRQNSQFKRGQSVIIYFEVAGVTDKMNIYGTYDVNLKERVELRDPYGDRIPELSYLIDDNILETSPTKNYVKPFEYFFNLLQSDPLGTYTQTITIEDKATGEFASQSIIFEVVE